MKKRGQFYLLTTILILSILIGTVTVTNFIQQKSDINFYYFGDELNIESQKVLDYGLVNSANFKTLFTEFSQNFTEYSGPGRYYYLFGNQTELTVGAYNDFEDEIFQIDVGAGNEDISIFEGQHKYEDFIPEDGYSTANMTIGGIKYDFQIEDSENFHFVVIKEFGGERHVSVDGNRQKVGFGGAGNQSEEISAETDEVFLANLGAVSWWKLKGNADDEFELNDGDINGIDCSSLGKYGNGCTFDGSDDYVEIPDSSSLDISEELTLSAWVNITDESLSSEQGIVSKGGDSVGEWGVYNLIYIRSGDRFRFETNHGGSYLQVYGDNSINIDEDTWYHVVGTFNQTQSCIYLNGDLHNCVGASTSISTDNSPLGIGRHGGYRLEGAIDEVIIFNQTLTEQEVSDLYERDFS